MSYQTTDLSSIPMDSNENIWNRRFISIFFVNMTMNLGQQMSNSLLAKYADSLGAPASQIGMLMSMFAITALLFKTVSAPMMDTYNRKYLVIGAMLIMAVAYFGFSVSSTISTLMVFRLFQGCGNAFGNVCCLAIVAETLPKDKFGTGMGYYACAQVVSQAIGPAVGLKLVGWFGYNVTYAINAMVMLSAAVIASRLKLTHKRTKKLVIKLDNIIAKEAILPGTVIMFLAMGFTTINSFLIVFASKQGVEDGIGLFFTVYALTMLITRPLMGKLTDRYGLVLISVPAIMFTMLSFVIISTATTLPTFLLAAFVNAFGFGACQPALQSLSMKSVPPERRGAGSSTNYIGMDLGTLVGPIIAGTCAESIGYVQMWRVMIVPLAIGILLLIIFRKNVSAVEENFKTIDLSN